MSQDTSLLCSALPTHRKESSFCCTGQNAAQFQVASKSQFKGGGAQIQELPLGSDDCVRCPRLHMAEGESCSKLSSDLPRGTHKINKCMRLS